MVDQDVMREREYRWRDRLAGCALVMEVDADEDEVSESFGWLGERFRWLEEREERERLLRMYEATVLVSLSTLGGRDYESGSFWPQIATEFGGPLPQPEYDLLAQTFKQALSRNGLRRFTTPLKNVGEILMHAGVPVASLEHFLKALMHRDLRVEGTGGRQFAGWASTLSRQAAGVYGLDAPTHRFLTEGGEIAEDFVDRCLLAVDAVSSGLHSAAFELGLSRKLIDEIARLLENGTVNTSASVRRRDRVASTGPILRWDRAGQGVTVALPEVLVDDDIESTWTVVTEGRHSSYVLRPEWPGQPLPTVVHVVDSPSKVISASIEPAGRSWEVGLIDPEDPLLVFDGVTGDGIPARNSLPRGRVVIGVPASGNQPFRELVEFRDFEPEIHEHPAPYGWEQWLFATVDVSHVAKFRRGDDRWRYTSTVSRPEIAGLEIIPGLSTVGGDPILSSPPHLVVPAATGRSEAAHALWNLRLSDLATGKLIWAKEVRSDSQPVEVALGSGDVSGMIGEFQLVAQGPLGRGVTRYFAIAEGWAFKSNPGFRYMSGAADGLEVAEGTLSGGGEEIDLPFGSNETIRVASIACADGRALEVRAEIPYMSINVRGRGEGRRAAIRPLSIDVEDLESLTMRIVVPSGESGALALMDGNGKYLQAIRGGDTASRGFIDFNLAQASDTARIERSLQVRMVFGKRSMPVALFRPRALAEGIRLEEMNRLTIYPPARLVDLSAVIYPRYAPWRAPYVVDMNSGVGSLPLSDEIIAHGQVRILMRIDDPWAPTSPPSRAGVETINVFEIELGETADLPNDAENQFARWLAGEGERPSLPGAAELAARLYGRINEFDSDLSEAELRSALAAIVGTDASSLVGALSVAPLLPSRFMELIVESGIAASPVISAPRIPGVWLQSVFLGVLCESWALGQSEEEIYLSELRRFAGESAIALLESGKDELGKIGRFGPEAAAMSAMTSEQLDEIWAAAGPIPGRALDLDSRTLHARELFDNRHSEVLDNLVLNSRSWLDRARTVLRSDLGLGGLGPVNERTSEGGWLDLPAISIAFALVARLAARKVASAQRLFEVARGPYVGLAAVAPSMVEQDLTIAELWLTSRRNEWKR